ncbi:MAG: hypothetical protein SFU98_18885 [Leptospiraceae bacterium]|nr:hypothetical protein [Leptospiraceae bacterium]
MSIKSLISKIKEYFKSPNDIIIAISDVRATGIRHKEGIYFDEAITRENFSFDKIVLADGTQTDYKSLVKKMAKYIPSRFVSPRVFITLHANLDQEDSRKFANAVLFLGDTKLYTLYSPFFSTIYGMDLFENEKSNREYQRGFFIYSDYSSTIFVLYFMDICYGLETLNKKLSEIDYETFQTEIEKLKNVNFNPLEQFESFSEQEKEDIQYAWSKPFSETISILSPTKLSFNVTEFKINHSDDYPNAIVRGCQNYIDSLEYFKNYKKDKLNSISNPFLRWYEREKQHASLDENKILNSSIIYFLFILIIHQLYCGIIFGGAIVISILVFLYMEIWRTELLILFIFGSVLIGLKLALFRQVEIFVLVFRRMQKGS